MTYGLDWSPCMRPPMPRSGLMAHCQLLSQWWAGFARVVLPVHSYSASYLIVFVPTFGHMHPPGCVPGPHSLWPWLSLHYSMRMMLLL